VRRRVPLHGDEDLYPFWDLSTELLVGLRELHEAPSIRLASPDVERGEGSGLSAVEAPR